MPFLSDHDYIYVWFRTLFISLITTSMHLKPLLYEYSSVCLHYQLFSIRFCHKLEEGKEEEEVEIKGI
jgi:hypothetical protein